MVQENPAKQYVVGVWYYRDATRREYRPWAFSAQDAKFQVEEELKKTTPIPGYVSYVGPFNPDCKCSNECRCGILTAEEATSRA
jgi:hypothetical protein